MSSIQPLIHYRLARAKEVLEDAKILAENKRWNSAINRLYYAAYYAVMALLLKSNIKPVTHVGAKTAFSQHFIKPGVIAATHGKLYSQLFTWRQKGDYDDLFDFDQEKVMPYFEPVQNLIKVVEDLLNK